MRREGWVMEECASRSKLHEALPPQPIPVRNRAAKTDLTPLTSIGACSSGRPNAYTYMLRVHVMLLRYGVHWARKCTPCTPKFTPCTLCSLNAYMYMLHVHVMLLRYGVHWSRKCTPCTPKSTPHTVSEYCTPSYTRTFKTFARLFARMYT
jgi:hypothetical protein